MVLLISGRKEIFTLVQAYSYLIICFVLCIFFAIRGGFWNDWALNTVGLVEQCSSAMDRSQQVVSKPMSVPFPIINDGFT